MPDTFLITILFIAGCTMIGAFIAGRSRDRCLKDFNGYPVMLRMKDEKTIWGRIRVENTGLELLYDRPHEDDDHIETSYILYKGEYDGILALIQYKDMLTAHEVESRSSRLEKAKNPGWFSRVSRSIRNVFGTVRDSLMEIASLLIGRAKSTMPAGKVLKGQDKYVSQLQKEGLSAVGTAYEPVLERYLGKKVVVAVATEGGKKEYSGILKEYTARFLEILDVEYKSGTDGGQSRLADLIILRNVGVVRHAGAKEA
jgi:small nuclear ribonucleoprotein (snRNP)-like protein